MKRPDQNIKRVILELERRKCADSPLYFAMTYCRTLDADDRETPLKLFPDFPYLKKLFEALRYGGDIHIEKSRQMFISWALMTWFLWEILFLEKEQLLAISAKEELVDDGGKNSTPQSLLGKVRFLYSHLPSFLSIDKDGKEALSFKKLCVTNSFIGSMIKGESSNPNAGRGGNYNRILIDEAAFVPNSEAVFTAARLACKKGIIICSTPNGKGSIHWRIKYGAKDSGFQTLRFHWGDHPHRTEKWYNQRRRSMTDEQIARELDISYEDSVVGRIFTEFNFKKHVSPYRLIYNPDLPLYTTWDFGIGDPTAILFIQTDPMDSVYIIDEFQDSGKDTSYYTKEIVKVVKTWGYPDDDALQILKNAAHYGDPAGSHRGARLESWIGDIYQRLGIMIQTKPGVAKIDKINRVKMLLRNGNILISPHCTRLIEAVQNYRRETDRMGRVLSEKPVHNWASHFNDALQEFAVNRFSQNLQKFETFRLEL